jgi:hypothetical protein
VLRVYEQQCVTMPLCNALSKLHTQLETTSTTEAPLERVPCDKTLELSWGRQSPQLTPTPSPSPSPVWMPKTWHHRTQSFPTPPIRHSCASTPCPPRLQKLPPSHVDLTRSHLRQARCRHLIACSGVHERAKAGHWKGASENWMRRADGLGALLEAEQGDDPGQE